MHDRMNGFKKNHVAFDDEIPDDGPELFMLRLKGSKVIHFTIWGTGIRGVWYHWRKSRSEPHFSDPLQCPGCKDCCEKKWKGYLHGYCAEMRQEVFLELTRNSARSLRDQLNNPGSMRGSVVQVKRTGSDNGRIYVSVLTPIATPEILPAEKDPRPSILKLWGLDEKTIEDWLADENSTEHPNNFI